MEARFRKYMADTPTETGCILWTGYSQQLTPNYRRPFFSVATSKSEPAHRVAYKLFRGEIPDGLVVRHTCDDPMCVNPDHLLLGTQRDNMRDMAERGRGRVPHRTVGERNPHSKLTEQLVSEIRSSTETRKQIALRLGVSPSTIGAVRQGRNWKHCLPNQ